MAVDFRGHPMFPSTGFNAPTRFEADIYDCEVWGKVPSDIEGNFYRMQCDFQYRPPQNEWPTGFNGDGHISRFHFNDGNVNFRARYVKTARLMAERAAHRRLFGVYRNHYTDDPSVKYIDRCGDWTLDDICNAYPPHASDIRRGVMRSAAPSAQPAAVDHMWGA